MRKLVKKLTAFTLVSVMVSSMLFSTRQAVYADETVAEGETAAAEGEAETAPPTTSRNYRRILVAGDSTACNFDAVSEYTVQGSHDPQAGWIECIKSFITDSQILQVQNGTVDGYSLKTYYDGFDAKGTPANQLSTLLSSAGGGQPGDYLLIQFGQSDSLAPNDSMTEQERKYA